MKKTSRQSTTGTREASNASRSRRTGRRSPPKEALLTRAKRLYRIPGVTQAEVCERLGLSRGALNWTPYS